MSYDLIGCLLGPARDRQGEDAPLPVKRLAARVGTAARLGDGPSRHTRVVFRLVEAEPAAVPAGNTTLVMVITARAVTVPP